ncbi:tetratricopeptide repeat protein, partial [Marinobacter alexandrii]
RVQRNRELVDEVGAGGYRGEDIYERKLATLRKLQPAYDAHDEARKLASEGDMDAALKKVNEAIRLAPDEAMFYTLRGRIYKEQEKLQEASDDFDKAVSLYPEMFVYRLYNGLNALKLNNLDKARNNLERANQVVPTSIAYLRLGDIAARQNRRDDAVAYYSKAAEAGGDVAKEAQQKLEALRN